MKKGQSSNFVLVSIVAIVAVIGLVVLFMGAHQKAATSTVSYDASDNLGGATLRTGTTKTGTTSTNGVVGKPINAEKGTGIPNQVVCGAGQLTGDLNGDGLIDQSDLNILQEIYLGNVPYPTPSNMCCVDANQDGSIDVGDYVTIQLVIEGSLAPANYCGPVLCVTSTGWDALNGDANGDGSISQIDLNWVQNIVLGKVSFAGSRRCCADFNADGAVNIIDIIKIQRIILELDNPSACWG